MGRGRLTPHVCRTRCRSYTCKFASSSFTMATRRRPRLPHAAPAPGYGWRLLGEAQAARPAAAELGHGFNVIFRNGRAGSLAELPFQKVKGGWRCRCCCAAPRNPSTPAQRRDDGRRQAVRGQGTPRSSPRGCSGAAANTRCGLEVGKRLTLPILPSGLVTAGGGTLGTACGLGTNQQQLQQQTLPTAG